jgi:cytochrome b6-f complex iron-sulfur subunit
MRSTNMPDSKSSSPISRRHFFELVGVGAIATAALGSTALSIDFLAPRVLQEPPTRFVVGSPSDFPPGSVRLFREHGVYVIRTGEGAFRALSAVCTHLGCLTAWKAAESVIACPCHGSRFGIDGQVVGGPAPRPLAALQMTIADDGLLVVDTQVAVAHDSLLKV